MPYQYDRPYSLMVGVIGGSGTDCLSWFAKCRGSKSRHRLLFSPNGKDKSTEKFLIEIALDSGGRL